MLGITCDLNSPVRSLGSRQVHPFSALWERSSHEARALQGTPGLAAASPSSAAMGGSSEQDATANGARRGLALPSMARCGVTALPHFSLSHSKQMSQLTGYAHSRRRTVAYEFTATWFLEASAGLGSRTEGDRGANCKTTDV
jgi:hypothetical protein